MAANDDQPGAETDEQEQRQFAEWQLERELSAREQIARAAGIALIQLTAILEEPGATLDPHIPPLGMILVAFAARGRRLLRSAYRLLDAGEAAEAVPLLRILSEYLIVGRWLALHPDRLDAWALADLRKRAYGIGEVLREIDEGPAGDEIRATLEAQRQELLDAERDWLARRGEPQGDVVNVEQMAAAVELGFAYQLAYRTQSQIDVHATPLAADACYERQPDGRLRLLPMPAHALRPYNQYEVGAHLLRDLLATTNDAVPTFLWSNGIEGVTAALNAMRESDPRKDADPRVSRTGFGGDRVWWVTPLLLRA